MMKVETRRVSSKTLLSYGLLMLFILGACSKGGNDEPLQPDQQTSQTEQAMGTGSPQPLAQSPEPSAPSTPTPDPPTNTPSPTETLTPVPTEDTRIPPESWREWPIIPTLNASMEAVYLAGVEMGNDPRHFSKVGDCQNVPNVFMGFYDEPGRVRFSERYAHLQETVDNFDGSFDRYGYALKGGFNFPAIFSPLMADPAACKPGETPIECEFRIHKPTFAIISLETWYSGRTVETYEGYLRRAVEHALSQGIVPILATKADNVEGNHSINLTTARLAYEYDVPLWNFWLAAQYLPNHGIDWDRDSRGFHITVDAWNTRSFTGLQTLDALWRAARNLVPTE